MSVVLWFKFYDKNAEVLVLIPGQMNKKSFNIGSSLNVSGIGLRQ